MVYDHSTSPHGAGRHVSEAQVEVRDAPTTTLTQLDDIALAAEDLLDQAALRGVMAGLEPTAAGMIVLAQAFGIALSRTMGPNPHPNTIAVIRDMGAKQVSVALSLALLNSRPSPPRGNA